MALPIWISGFTGSMPDALAWLINGSPECCPELSNCFDTFDTELGGMWDAPGEADLEDYKILGRKKFWNPLIASTDPEYMDLRHEFDDATKLASLLKNDVEMIGRREHYEHYAEKCLLLPPRQRFHGMQIRTANLDSALQWVPGSRAVWASSWSINNPTVIYNWTDMSVRANLENGLGKGLLTNDKFNTISWPPETGNSSNGYIPEQDMESISHAYSKHILANMSLWIKLQHKGVKFISVDDFMNHETVMDVYKLLNLKPPTTEWVTKWLTLFREKSNYSKVGYNPSLDDIKELTRKSLMQKLDYESDHLSRFEKAGIREKINELAPK